MKRLLTTFFYTLVFTQSYIAVAQVVNPIPVNLVGSSDPISADFFMHTFTPSPLGGTYHGGTYYGATKEKWGYNISALTPGVEYSLTVYYMMDQVQGTPAYNRTADFSMQSGAGLDITSIAYIPEPDWTVWYSVDVTFTAITATDRFDVEAESISDNSVWVFTDVSAAAVDVACDPLTTTATETEICLGESITFSSISSNGGVVTWDGGITNDVPYTPASAGTFTYHVTSDFDGDCEDSITVTVNPLPTVTASVDFTSICLGDDVIFTGGGADTYVWDMGVTDGVSFTPAAEGTVTYTVTGTDAITGCENTASIDVTVTDNPVVTATASPEEICLGESVTFTGGGADTYLWDGGITDGVAFTPASSGTFTYNVTGSLSGSGCSNTASVDITVYDSPTVTAAVTDTEICEGESIVFTGGGADTYVWDMGVTDGVSFTPGTIGTTTYTVTGTGDGGCADMATIDVTVFANPTVTATVTDDEICFGESVIFTGGGADSYAWDSGVTDGISFTPGTIGTNTYTVTGTDINGCTNTADVSVMVVDCDPVTALFEFSNNICVGDCIDLTDLSEGPVASWEWDFGGAVDPTTSTEQHPFLCFGTVGTFTIQLTITSIDGLTSTTSNTITVNETPVITALNDTIIDAGGTATLIGSTTSSGEFTWSPERYLNCPDCQITDASPLENTNYSVVLVDENGCTAQDSVRILVNFAKGIGVPSAFSPNGDGNNDVLYVKGVGIAGMSFRIYNRYGEVVFESNDQNIGWDGTFKNRDENPGVFTWVLVYTFADQNGGTLKGNTTLIR